MLKLMDRSPVRLLREWRWNCQARGVASGTRRTLARAAPRAYWAWVSRSLRRRGRKVRPEAVLDFLWSDAARQIVDAMQVRSEFAGLLARLAERRPRTLLEIGTANGGSLFAFACLAAPDATIISIDLPRGPFGGVDAQTRGRIYRRFAAAAQRLHLLLGSSHDPAMIEQVRAILARRPLDFLFIDGDHSYDGVRQDFLTYSPLVRPGGLTAFHDIVEGREQFVGGVRRFWLEVRLRYPATELVEDPRQGGAGIGVLEMPGDGSASDAAPARRAA